MAQIRSISAPTYNTTTTSYKTSIAPKKSVLLRDMKIVPLQTVPHFARVAASYCWDEWSTRFQSEFYMRTKEDLIQEMMWSFTCQCFVAHVDNLFLGTVCIHVCDLPSRLPHLTPWVQSLFVVPEFRKRGIGRALLDYVTSNVRRSFVFPISNDPHMYLHCKHNNVKWFKQQGWEPYHLFHHESIVVMSKLI